MDQELHCPQNEILQEEQQIQEEAYTGVDMNIYREYLDRITKTLEQSSQFTNSLMLSTYENIEENQGEQHKESNSNEMLDSQEQILQIQRLSTEGENKLILLPIEEEDFMKEEDLSQLKKDNSLEDKEAFNINFEKSDYKMDDNEAKEFAQNENVEKLICLSFEDNVEPANQEIQKDQLIQRYGDYLDDIKEDQMIVVKKNRYHFVSKNDREDNNFDDTEKKFPAINTSNLLNSIQEESSINQPIYNFNKQSLEETQELQPVIFNQILDKEKEKEVKHNQLEQNNEFTENQEIKENISNQIPKKEVQNYGEKDTELESISQFEQINKLKDSINNQVFNHQAAQQELINQQKPLIQQCLDKCKEKSSNYNKENSYVYLNKKKSLSQSELKGKQDGNASKKDIKGDQDKSKLKKKSMDILNLNNSQEPRKVQLNHTNLNSSCEEQFLKKPPNNQLKQSMKLKLTSAIFSNFPLKQQEIIKVSSKDFKKSNLKLEDNFFQSPSDYKSIQGFTSEERVRDSMNMGSESNRQIDSRFSELNQLILEKIQDQKQKYLKLAKDKKQNISERKAKELQKQVPPSNQFFNVQNVPQKEDRLIFQLSAQENNQSHFINKYLHKQSNQSRTISNQDFERDSNFDQYKMNHPTNQALLKAAPLKSPNYQFSNQKLNSQRIQNKNTLDFNQIKEITLQLSQKINILKSKSSSTQRSIKLNPPSSTNREVGTTNKVVPLKQQILPIEIEKESLKQIPNKQIQNDNSNILNVDLITPIITEEIIIEKQTAKPLKEENLFYFGAEGNDLRKQPIRYSYANDIKKSKRNRSEVSTSSYRGSFVQNAEKSIESSRFDHQSRGKHERSYASNLSQLNIVRNSMKDEGDEHISLKLKTLLL